MKKSVLSIILFMCILSISLVSALDISLSKNSYFPGETLQAQIQDAFPSTLLADNVRIYQENSAHEFPTQKGIVKSGKYLFYAILPEVPGNYFLRIEGIKHYESSTQSDSVVEKPFSIVSTNASYLSVNPGAVLATQDFRITVKAYNAYQDITIDFPPSNFKQSFNLGYFDSKTVYIPITGITKFTESSLKVGSYDIPVLVSPSNTVQINKSNETEIVEFEGNLGDLLALDTTELNASILPDYDYLFQIVVVNKNQSLKNINLSSPSPKVKISPEIIDILSHEEVINITINTESNLETSLKIRYQNTTLSIPIKIEIVNNINDTQSNIPTADSEKTCEQLSGKQCDYSKNEKCSGSLKLAKDGDCCVGKCGVPSSNSLGMIIGIVIILILLGVVFVLYQQYKKGTAPDFLNKLLKKRTEDYRRRVNPLEEPQEVRRDLSKV